MERENTNKGYIDQLMQLFQGVRWDGNLLAKSHMNALVKAGLAKKVKGFNLITAKGVLYLYNLGLIDSNNAQ